ncbi:MAG: 2-polyprenyl-3-methyl-5-hydroxy-6-metoxy-1,4-benzoquinol methylase [Chloroflexi bacterium AL-W]|nr:2-polyprenyl-3-methyl-5-hydroxy-6-metoxy-1,4-benzoquinol methylase [Chloroflexi bacterium AL-N1]NOK67492.1 2-polyprenyl-3-methyl-5-hydroxy-6-metoxy-1,4-benzoquinol methylase [Chloroflexi bacterium AL-N10]NOK75016.1 2-polyprenyl-3-methyl-5-hydroxy-6-metoxy-1,4-benzoquinol methylase [Chloroflexi bacterium AL-N5]NOK81803.1 2-polyprenyl-3-methyl-5-hydroxy-6-metoxy-1,4-benzoquinol methylase [Chloroflexi bacterium AL-W]NOK89649.1 2-polyprenyl-3-methyl-5-hydroxy-6-metoxy-1,4-benzoquinol methylase [
MINPNQRYYERLAAAFVRGKLHHDHVATTSQRWFETPLEELTSTECEALIQLGLEQGLRVHRFKQTAGLPRVRKVLGILKSLQPLKGCKRVMTSKAWFLSANLPINTW